jgi:hypothetical protein
LRPHTAVILSRCDCQPVSLYTPEQVVDESFRLIDTKVRANSTGTNYIEVVECLRNRGPYHLHT